MIKLQRNFQTKLFLLLSTALLGFNVFLGATALKPGKVIQSERIYSTPYVIKTVVIDAGHGGHDPGCHGASAHEKHITLAIAKKLGEQIRQRFPEVKVILTRDSDVFIPLHERADIANKNNADLFISIHCNAMPGNNSGTYGTETYVMGLHTAQYNLEVAKRENAAILLEDNYQKNYDYDPNSPEGHIMISMFQNAYLKQSLHFAELVEEKLNTQAKRRSRGVKQAGFVVLRATVMPSVLVETGFLTNPSEEQFLNGHYGQEQIAGAMLEAFVQYKTQVESPDFRSRDQYASEPLKEPVQTEPAAVAYSYASSNSAKNTNNNKPAELTNAKEIPAPERGHAPGGNVHSTGMGGTVETSSNRYGPVPSSTSANRYPNPAVQAPPFPAASSRLNVDGSKPMAPMYTFRIQLAATPTAANPNEAKWKALPYHLEWIREDNLYKVRTAAFSDYQQANQARMRCKELGFADAFIVALKDGQRIALPDAKKALGIQ
jgi:N-acetylmuramoyl-L-alanine amidase